MTAEQDANPFKGALGAEYEMLRLICPGHPRLVQRLGLQVAHWAMGETLAGFEIGCGTGVGTASLLAAAPGLALVSVDSSAKMLAQSQANLAAEIRAGRLRLVEADALEALRGLRNDGLDLVVSSYATHNFRADYRRLALAEAFRALKPGGLFVNADRYALDDREAHLASAQADVRHWFKTFAELGRPDLLEEWVVHLMSDESPDRIMYFSPALQELAELGFAPVRVDYREGVDTLVIATKPARSQG